MRSIFLRIYGGMLLALLLIGGLGLLGLHWINEMRGEHYREELAHGTLRLMADDLQPTTTTKRKRVLAQQGRLLGIPLQLHELDELRVDGRSRARLVDGQVLVKQIAEHAVAVYTQASAAENLVLSDEMQQVDEQLARAMVYLLMDELMRYPANKQPYHLARIVRDEHFGFSVRLLQVKELDLGDDQRRWVVEGDTVIALGKDGDSIRIFVDILGTPWMLELGPLLQMNLHPSQLLLLLGALCLSFIGLITYLLVRRLEQRLRSLEVAAVRIARGSLDTRIEMRRGDSVGCPDAAFNHMIGHIHRLLTIQREMVRAVFHELHTPVVRLRFDSEMIRTAETGGAHLKYLEGTSNDIQNLDKLVDEMLTYTRLEQGSPPLTCQRLELDVLVRQVVEEIAPLRREVLVSCEEGALVPEELGSWIEVEPRCLHRALQNLLTNALRHADRQVRTGYRVSLGRCRMDVEDDGSGVPEAQQERLFTPFLRLDDSRTHASDGHDLELSIVRRIVYRHGGRASINRSGILDGACFTLAWPRKAGLRDRWKVDGSMAAGYLQVLVQTYSRRSEDMSKGQSRRAWRVFRQGLKKSFSIGLVCLYSGMR